MYLNDIFLSKESNTYCQGMYISWYPPGCFCVYGFSSWCLPGVHPACRVLHVVLELCRMAFHLSGVVVALHLDNTSAKANLCNLLQLDIFEHISLSQIRTRIWLSVLFWALVE